MRQPSDMILADLVRNRASEKPDLDVLTFEHLSLDGGKSEDEVRSYSQLATNANRIAAAIIAKGLERGDRFGLIMRNHPEFVETMVAASITPSSPSTRARGVTSWPTTCGPVAVAASSVRITAWLRWRKRAPARLPSSGSWPWKPGRIRTHFPSRP